MKQDDSRVFAPAGEWAAFKRSSELMDWLYARLPFSEWQYVNPARGIAIWEHPTAEGVYVYVACDDANRVVECVIGRPALLAEFCSELVAQFGVLEVSRSGDREG